MTDTKKLSNAFKALSNPNRLRIYLEILDRRSKQVTAKDCGCGLTDFIQKLNIGAPTVSHHIKELVNAELIDVERNGKFMTCYLNDEMRDQLKHFFEQ
ncbi:MAG: metalloregulator ArsR/SmtB family transcription factor [Ketobacteraceae bacterium]|nr:metalloregulator ArsR/SmtB family transcription factor [Ketobacteraceae bacterium]